jgi:hypothetical protein
MADWKAIIDVNLVGSARLLAGIDPLVVDESAIVVFASQAAYMGSFVGKEAIDEILTTRFISTSGAGWSLLASALSIRIATGGPSGQCSGWRFGMPGPRVGEAQGSCRFPLESSPPRWADRSSSNS